MSIAHTAHLFTNRTRISVVKIENIQGIIPFTDKKINIDLNGKNLILTGKNGCGKTQLLESIFEVLLKSPTFAIQKNNLHESNKKNKTNYLERIKIHEENIENCKDAIRKLEKNFISPKLNEQRKNEIRNNILNFEENIKTEIQNISRFNEAIENLEIQAEKQLHGLRSHIVSIGNAETKNTIVSYKESNDTVALLMFFDAFRRSGFQPVQNITSLEQEKTNIKQQAKQLSTNRGRSNAGALIERFLANWEVKSALRERKKDFSVTNQLEAWKDRFVEQLKVLLDDNSTDIHFDDETLNYSISQKHKMNFSFRDLSAGYSSILKVFTELLMTVEVSEFTPEEINGFVVIDELDAHLHPSLQRKVLPFFSDLFPNIQFIVSTHSPFVISSENDTVVYDLSTKALVDDDLRTYNNDIILESILEVPNYSLYLEKILNNLNDPDFVKRNLDEVKRLIDKADLLDDESFVQLSSAYRKYNK